MPAVNAKLAFRISAFVGVAAVSLGAFGAHGLKNVLEQNGTAAIWQTAALYHLVHSVVLVFAASLRPFPVWAWRLFAVGILVFSGTLYVLAVTNIKWLGAITPLGGTALIAGWVALAFWKGAGRE